MTIELTQEQHEILKQTSRIETPAEFQTLLNTAKARMDTLVKEVQEPNQPVSVTLTELRDLALTVHQHKPELDAKSYTAEQRAALCDAIRLADTSHAWFGEGARTGAYRTRTVLEVVEASRPWRDRLKAFGGHAFVFDQERADQLADVNSTGTLQEEVDDLGALNKLVSQNHDALAAVGMTDAFVEQGKTLYEEANGRDVVGILGLRNREEATQLRNRILTYATLLGREARAAGVNACFDDPAARRRFEAASFKEAMRRLRPRRGRSHGGGGGEEKGTAEEGKEKGAAPEKGATGTGGDKG
jgi:hypothetical protein